jgi:hypothetical protein
VHIATADSIWAFELGQRATEIAGKLGVSAVRFGPGPLPSAAAAVPATAAPAPTPEQVRDAALLAVEIRDEKLRESVQKAISLGLARAAANRPV